MATSLAARDLSAHGLEPSKPVHWNLAPAALIEEAVRRGEGQLTSDGAFVGITTPHTGRSPNDKFVVREGDSEERIDWGSVNVPLDRE
ncbi:MAG: phosphoenolpyruvate carboxykinase (ATP), partial [Longimicrobiales bacterium]